MVVIIGAMPGGGRGVKPLESRCFSLSGDFTIQGRSTELVNVMIEKTTRDSDPTRPMSPRGSLDFEADALAE